MKAIFVRCLFIILGLTVGILLTEGTLRVVNALHIVSIDKNKSFANDPFIYSASLKYRIKPYRTRNCTAVGNPPAICYANYEGFRDKDYSVQKPANTFRIITIGDSLTYGPGVNNDGTYPRIFEKLVDKNNKEKKHIEVINMGMIFYGPQQYYSVYKQFAQGYHPDLIILSFHYLTDNHDAYEFNQNRRFYLLKSLPDDMPYPLSQFLKEHSYLWRAILSVYYRWANKQEIPVDSTVFHDMEKRFQYDTQVKYNSPPMQEGWRLSEQSMASLVSDAKKNGSQIMVVAFPAPVQIIPDEWKRMKAQGYASDIKLYEDTGTRNTFKGFCQKYQWSCLDLTDSLRKEPNPQRLFLKGDIHYTKAGNTVTANSIYAYLKIHNFLKPLGL